MNIKIQILYDLKFDTGEETINKKAIKYTQRLNSHPNNKANA